LEKLDHLFPGIRTVWFTGAEHSEENLAKIGCRIEFVDAILWGKLRHEDGKVVKYLSQVSDNHRATTKIFTGEYASKFEEEINETSEAC
jgi:hypothetical protein